MSSLSARKIEAKSVSEFVKAVGRLTPSLLALAFAGKLVPQDPNDEPAPALLARLHAGSSATDGKTKRS